MRDLAKNIRLPSIDDLFSTEEERQDAKLEKIQILPLSELHPFEGHPFQVRDDEEMDKMVDSVKEYGVMTPAIVRPRRDGGYEIVAGHRRCHASQRAGVDTMPCIVRDMDDDTAIILMVDSNCQREHILPSEKAKAYQMKLEAIKRKGGRPLKINSGQLGQNLSQPYSVEKVADEAGESVKQVQRFIRLNKLTPDLMQLVDDGRLKTTPRGGAELPDAGGTGRISLLYGGRRLHSVLIPSAEAESCQQGKCSDERQDSRDHVCPFPQRKAARTAAHDCRIQGRTLFPEGLYLRTDGKYHPETSGKLLPQAAGLRTMRWRYDKSFDYRTGLLPLSGCL